MVYILLCHFVKKSSYKLNNHIQMLAATFMLIYKLKLNNMRRIVRKPDFCLCETKEADQLHSNCEADQRLCFRYTVSTISLLLKSEISSLKPSVTVQACLCCTWSETPKTGFLAMRLICKLNVIYFFADLNPMDSKKKLESWKRNRRALVSVYAQQIS